MVENRLKSNITFLISVISLVMSIIVMILGDNLLERFEEPELVMASTKNDFNLPDKLNEIIVNNIDREESNLIPNTIRIVTIKNNGGTPSKNLNLVIEMDGPIYQYKLNSPEIIDNQKVEFNKLFVNLSRLSKNAEVSMIFWIRDESNKFNATYADDNNSGYIYSSSESKKDNNIFYSIPFMVFITSIITILYEEFKKYIFVLKKENQVSRQILIDNITDLYKEQILKNEEEKVIFNQRIANDEVKQKLNEIIKISSELTN